MTSASSSLLVGNKLPASIEVTPRQAIESEDLPGLFPKGVRVYIPDLGTDSTDTLVRAARRVRDLGYEPVPHFAARRLTTHTALESRVKALAEVAGVRDVLVIGGGLETPAGEYASTMDVLETGYFDRYGITEIGVAGHPEGSPDFSEARALDALQLKKAFGERTNASLRIVTQFGFDPQGAIDWAEGLQSQGIDLPIHLGVAGPAKLPTLIKYAAMCGVGNSIDFLKKRAGSLTSLVTGPSPDDVVVPIETHVGAHANALITQLHVFPFVGIKKAAHWLKERGSWPQTTGGEQMHRSLGSGR